MMTSQPAPEARGASSEDAGSGPAGTAGSGRISAAAFVGILIATMVAAPAFADLEPWSGGAKPDFALPSLDHGRIRLAHQQGNLILVHFFATWCAPCRPEMASLQGLAERYEPQALTILAVDVAEVEPRLRRFFETQPVSFPILLDADRSVTKAWGVESLPTTFVLDSRVVPRLFTKGEVDWSRSEVDRAIEALLAEAPARGT
jgi:peroxiredoxin